MRINATSEQNINVRSVSIKSQCGSMHGAILSAAWRNGPPGTLGQKPTLIEVRFWPQSIGSKKSAV